ncbi:alpha/beta hydrolase [Actinocorallia lasiicapitis]
MSRRNLVLAATALGLSAAGAGVAGVAAQRHAVRRLDLRPDPHAGEAFGSLRGRPTPVFAEDGTRLYAEIDNDDRSDLAIVFCHGWTCTQDTWHFQRKALRGLGRLVFWDQRGHGRSDSAKRHSYGLPTLSHDLKAVIDQTVPEGTPVILVGHSMGGMTIMRFADDYPELIGTKVIAAALLNTSSGALDEVTLGLPAAIARINKKVLPRGIKAAGFGAGYLERLRHLSKETSLLIEDLIAFGPDASPAAVRFAGEMLESTRLEALTDFFLSMITHPEIATCAPLTGIETLIIAAENDTLTPVDHSLTIATRCPQARLEVIPTAGHMAMLERPSLVSDHLGDLIERTRKNL